MVRDFSCFFTLSREEMKKEWKSTADLLGTCSGSSEQPAVI
jgi:hypothetical protein